MSEWETIFVSDKIREYGEGQPVEIVRRAGDEEDGPGRVEIIAVNEGRYDSTGIEQLETQVDLVDLIEQIKEKSPELADEVGICSEPAPAAPEIEVTIPRPVRVTDSKSLGYMIVDARNQPVGAGWLKRHAEQIAELINRTL